MGNEAKVTIVDKNATLCFGISIIGDEGGMDSEPGYDKITEEDFLRAANSLQVSVAVVKALDEVLSDNKGGFYAVLRPVYGSKDTSFGKSC